MRNEETEKELEKKQCREVTPSSGIFSEIQVSLSLSLSLYHLLWLLPPNVSLLLQERPLEKHMLFYTQAEGHWLSLRCLRMEEALKYGNR